VIGLFPADAMIHDVDSFRCQLKEAAEFIAGSDSILTFSISPSYPATGYGYLRLGDEVRKGESTSLLVVEKFVEKPDAYCAQEYFDGKGHGWNAGMFLWKGETFLKECQVQQPDLASFIERFPLSKQEQDSYLKEEFPALPKISVDFAIMEHAQSVIAMNARFDWDDVGSWTALPTHLGLGVHKDTFRGKVISLDSSHNIVIAGKHTVALCGVSDLVVVETDDAVLVCHRNAVEKIKKLPLPPELK
jgi:mannose-1-phosphate guanylyltransferase